MEKINLNKRTWGKIWGGYKINEFWGCVLRSTESSAVPEVDDILDVRSNTGDTEGPSAESLKYKVICRCNVEFRGPLSCCTAAIKLIFC